MLLDGIDCENQPLERSEENDICELLGGAAPACTASRPCPRMVCIPQGIFSESVQVMELFGAMRTAETLSAGGGLELLRVSTIMLSEAEGGRLWRLLTAMTRWSNANASELREKAKSARV